MTKAEITAIVKPLVAEERPKEVLDLLSQYVKGHDRYLENDLLMQMASFNRNTRDHTNGLLSASDYGIAMARLSNALTYIIEKLPIKGNQVAADIPQSGARGISPEAADSKKKILFMTANPHSTNEILKTEQEMREVKDEIRSATNRDDFELIFEPAVRIPTITKAMRRHKPEIVHFSGHGAIDDENTPIGIVVEDKVGGMIPFPTEGLARLFKISRDHVECVLLNACYSKAQAQVISEYEIYVIGMSDAVGDDTAREFAVGFYQSLAEGDSFEIAYDIAMVNIAHQVEDAHLPELWYKGEKVV